MGSRQEEETGPVAVLDRRSTTEARRSRRKGATRRPDGPDQASECSGHHRSIFPAIIRLRVLRASVVTDPGWQSPAPVLSPRWPFLALEAGGQQA